MALVMVASPNYQASAGLAQVRDLQQALVTALKHQNWLEVQRLDRSCAALIEKVISANRDDSETLFLALNELKSVYSCLINRCQEKVASMAI